MRNLVLLSILLLSMRAVGQAPVGYITTEKVAPGKGYSQAVVVDLGKSSMIIISGQIALDKEGNLVGKDSVEKQAEQVFLNIQSIVTAAGGTMNDIVKLTYFVTDITQIQSIRKIRDKFVNISHPPASTLVQVSGLLRKDLLMEVEATAVIARH